ncbi:unnamed protein product [Taenia asiatica]|uniref:LIM domain protein n=1 Tax=Taenia asiatica TaxID=60517 RepID=A0A0R3W406_TAEAS|nr:unnamed protein product [Taenia asiatica]
MVEKCAKCHGDITGQVVIALGQKWHNECFVCLGCRTPLQGKSFFNKDGSIYCIECRKEKFDPTCAKCHRKIDPTIKYSIYQDKTYHRDCFTCAQCRLPLDGKRFVIKDGQFQNMVDKCAKCGKEITGTVVTAMDKKWHNECFVCAGCKCKLAGKSFHNRDGTPYCIDCRKEKFDPTCTKCHKKIDPTIKYSIYQEKPYHMECFTCAQCKQPLDGKKFVVKDGQYICADHK